MEESRFVVPTYYGARNKLLSDAGYARLEFSDPLIPILVREADGLRLVLGSHDCDDKNAPDIQVERRPNGWAIFLHPVGGSDPSGYVYFLDDGRSFVVPERGLGPTPSIVALGRNECVPEIDGSNSATEQTEEEPQGPCEFCGLPLEYSGDNWDGLCPGCADRVSAYLDRKGLTDQDRDAAIAFLKTRRK